MNLEGLQLKKMSEGSKFLLASFKGKSELDTRKYISLCYAVDLWRGASGIC